jgi:hypothetical protein
MIRALRRHRVPRGLRWLRLTTGDPGQLERASSSAFWAQRVPRWAALSSTNRLKSIAVAVCIGSGQRAPAQVATDGRAPGSRRATALPRRSAAAMAWPARQTWPSAAIAQPVEHVIRNDGVGGSSPSCGTNVSNKLADGQLVLGASNYAKCNDHVALRGLFGRALRRSTPTAIGWGEQHTGIPAEREHWTDSKVSAGATPHPHLGI